MRQKSNQNGFVLMIVIIILGVMGIGISIWAAQTHDLIIHTRMIMAQARLDNAIASAAQWAKMNQSVLKEMPLGQSVSLNLKDLQMPGSDCRLCVTSWDSIRMEIEIRAQTNWGSKSFKKTTRLSL